MDYKKAYEEALGWMRSIYPTLTGAEKEDAEHYFPELKESEDERTRRELVDFILYKAGNLLDEDTEHRYITYLERAKDHFRDDTKKIEQKPLSTEETELNSIAFLEQLGYTCIPPKKEHQNNADTPNESSWAGKISSSHKDKNLDEIAQDYIKGVKECNTEPTWDLIQTAVCYGYHLAEQRSSEWSEEDSRTIGTLSSIIFDYAFYKDALDENNDLTGEYAELYNWLQYLPEKFNLQPKQEWSEEDEKNWNEYIERLKAEYSKTPNVVLWDDINWLEYLHERLKSIRPQPHWKPSDEQMDALISATCTPGNPLLISLYHDLQKLL